MRTLLSWSTGKDSAWALHVLRQRPDVAVVGLVTTVNAAFDRVAMHGVRRELARGPGRGCRPAAARAGDPPSLPQRRLRAHHGRVRGRAGRRRRRGHGLRRPVPGGHPPLSRGKARRHRDHAAVPAVGHRHRAAGARNDRRRARRPMSRASTRASCPRASPAAASTSPCWPTCRRASTHAPRTASSTPSPAPARCSAHLSPSRIGEIVTRDGFVFCDLGDRERPARAGSGKHD